MLTRIYEGLVSRSVEGTRAARKAFNDQRLDTDGSDEGRILKLADRVEERTADLVSKAEAEAEAAKKRAPAESKPGPDAVPGAKN
jgi:hypothetical protein